MPKKGLKDIDYYLSLDYKLEIVKDAVEGGFVAYYPELRGCITCHDTLEGVKQNAVEAKRVWMMAMIEDGNVIPEPASNSGRCVMYGTETFEFDGQKLDYNFLDFWRFHYSNIYDIQGRIAEFIVAQALDIRASQNDQYWTLWDLTYRGIRVEVKETSYYHSFNKEGKVSQQRSFRIPKASGSYDPEVSGNNEYCRQNDVYVFCLNTGYTKEESYPLNLNNWEFYIVPTSVINENCGDNKTITLGKIKKLGYSPKRYDEIKNTIHLLFHLD